MLDVNVGICLRFRKAFVLVYLSHVHLCPYDFESVSVYVCVEILRTKHGWAPSPSRRYVALLWSRPSSRSRSADSTPPMGGGEAEKDLDWVEVWAGTQAACRTDRQIEACKLKDRVHSDQNRIR